MKKNLTVTIMLIGLALITKAQNTGFESYTKFDFIPGEKVLFYDDFSDVGVGEFPSNWNTDASGEVVTTNQFPGKWFRLKEDYSYYIPDFFETLPENYTVEFDALYTTGADFSIEFYQRAETSMEDGYYPGDGGLFINFFSDNVGWKNWDNLAEDEKIIDGEGPHEQFSTENTLQHYSIWIQKGRLRVYLNETKVVDAPRAVLPKFKNNQIRFGAYQGVMIGNIKLAAGLPDTRSRLLTEGKLVTRGILFDSGSARIKPESFGILKEIATVLKENAQVSVKIVGHTDSDGDETLNLNLSKSRAEAVKNALSTDFGIEAARMQTDGKGESEPSDSNTTTQGKANNRRVEFIKL
ncbi:MAG: OmpA family protein [Bacteroidia bacterium]|nr:OmpA family protein [Bacteroidia bacterium]